MTEKKTIPNPKNFCGGNFQDWIEVMLTEKCNGSCAWCVDRDGFRPKKHASWLELSKAIVDTGKKNVILLGGEPTLYLWLEQLIDTLALAEKNVYITTNGSMLTKEFVRDSLDGIAGVNVSIHDYRLSENKKITGIDLDLVYLREAIEVLHDMNAVVRLNCNLIQGHVDSEPQLLRFIEFAKSLGADSVRFAELKNDEKNFVDLNEIYEGKYGINNEPFGLGCNQDAKIDGMPVNFRQMCGLQMEGCKRQVPVNPVQRAKQVLYYDGIVYDGWQVTKESNVSKESKIVEVLEKVANGEMSVAIAAFEIGQMMSETKVVHETVSSGGCAY